jgi:hypothetical protein
LSLVTHPTPFLPCRDETYLPRAPLARLLLPIHVPPLLIAELPILGVNQLRDILLAHDDDAPRRAQGRPQPKRAEPLDAALCHDLGLQPELDFLRRLDIHTDLLQEAADEATKLVPDALALDPAEGGKVQRPELHDEADVEAAARVRIDEGDFGREAEVLNRLERHVAIFALEVEINVEVLIDTCFQPLVDLLEYLIEALYSCTADLAHELGDFIDGARERSHGVDGEGRRQEGLEFGDVELTAGAATAVQLEGLGVLGVELRESVS